MAISIFNTVNYARTNPNAFYQNNKAKIEEYNSNYAAKLPNIKPVKKALWNINLEGMAISSVDYGALDPSYKGDIKMCGFVSGKGSGNVPRLSDPIYFVCQMWQNIHYNNYKYFAIYFDKTNTNYSYQWGISCEEEKITIDFCEKIDSSLVNFAKLNSAKTANYMSEGEKRMLLEINFVRAYPKIYSKIIAEYMAKESTIHEGLNNETYDAGIELINELDTMTARPILQPMLCVYKAAKVHGLDCQKRKIVDHQGSDKSMPWDRILKQCTSLTDGNENLVGNPFPNPRVSVIELLIDSGISSRGHRYNMLNKKWKYGACYHYEDERFGNCWVQNFAY